MPRKLLADAYRGWWGWEGQCNAAMRMSNYTMWACKRRMDQEQWRHEEVLDKISASEKLQLRCARKTFSIVRDDYSRILAERNVFRTHAFKNYDPMYDKVSLDTRRGGSLRVERSPKTGPTSKEVPRRRPLTERRPQENKSDVKTRSHAGLSKRNVLPDIGRPKETITTGNTEKNRKPDSPKPKPVSSEPKPDLSSPISKPVRKMTPRPTQRVRLPDEGKGKTETLEGAFFVTQSDIMTSTLLEEDEEVEVEAVRESETQADTTAGEGRSKQSLEVSENPGTKTSEDDAATEVGVIDDLEVCGKITDLSCPERDADEPVDRAGKGPSTEGFQSIEFILEEKNEKGQRLEAADDARLKESLQAPDPSDLPSAHVSGSEGPAERNGSSAKESSLKQRQPDLNRISNPRQITRKDSRSHVKRPTRKLSIVCKIPRTSGISDASIVNKTNASAENTQSTNALTTPAKNLAATYPDASSVQLEPKPEISATLKTDQAQAGSAISSRPSSQSPQLLLLPSTDDQSEMDFTPLATASGQSELTRGVSVPHSDQSELRKPPKIGLAKFRQAAETIVEEQRAERELNSNFWPPCCSTGGPQGQRLRVRVLEKPQTLQDKEKKDMWKTLMLNVQGAVRWKAKTLRESQGILTTRQLKRRVIQQQPRERLRRVFPGACKTTWAMKKFMSREVDDMMAAMRPENRRRHINQQLLQKASLPDFVDRVKSTTAILREFRRYKMETGKEEDGVGRGNRTDDIKRQTANCRLTQTDVRCSFNIPLRTHLPGGEGERRFVGNEGWGRR
ncbi:hypothetical protein BaRGS_00009276 [Batillaria attramentaria]|uniref:Uncharacterized protein n=1 Tax=Batillaria attramentaria TaxID=370345 RepID=A0ABD0LJD0_9CAEN